MKHLRLTKDEIKEENIIKDKKSFRLKNKQMILCSRNKKAFQIKKENKTIKNRKIRDIRNLFEHEEDDYYKPVRVVNLWSNNYIEY